MPVFWSPSCWLHSAHLEHTPDDAFAIVALAKEDQAHGLPVPTRQPRAKDLVHEIVLGLVATHDGQHDIVDSQLVFSFCSGGI